MQDRIILLQEAYECGILDEAEVAKKIKMTKEKYVKEHHQYSISTRKDGRCITTVRKENENRQQIAAPSYKELINKLYDYYNDCKKANYTVNDLYEIWVKIRREKAMTTNSLDIKTVKRDEEHWQKYFIGKKLITLPIRKLTVRMLNNFLNDSITTFSLSRKEFSNMKTILNAIFQIAMDEEVLVSNPLLNARTTVKFHAVKKRRDGSKIFLEKEQDPLEEYLYQQRTVEAYSILLHFQIGTRIGELVALEAEDISDEEIYIHKTEIADKEYINGKYVNKGYKVVEYVKHDIEAGYRTILLTEKAITILEEVKNLSDGNQYLFTQSNGKRMTSCSYSYWLRKYCKEAGIPFKSSHNIRRTFASRLYSIGMSLEEISMYMGHEDTDTTKKYIYNYNEKSKNRALMNKAL